MVIVSLIVLGIYVEFGTIFHIYLWSVHGDSPPWHFSFSWGLYGLGAL